MHVYFFYYYYFVKKISYIGFAFHSKNSKINYTVKYFKKNTRDPQINSKNSRIFLEFSNIQKELVQPDIKTKR
jgi:hypothetical protein